MKQYLPNLAILGLNSFPQNNHTLNGHRHDIENNLMGCLHSLRDCICLKFPASMKILSRSRSAKLTSTYIQAMFLNLDSDSKLVEDQLELGLTRFAKIYINFLDFNKKSIF